jgi:uncharacterized SAM-binding protein YcdF (DUF218 family)
MFLTAKLLAFGTQPLAWAMLLLAAGLLCMARRRRLGLRLSWLALTILLLTGWEPLADLCLRQLEMQYPNPRPNAPLNGYAGMVVLGGALQDAKLWTAEGQIALDEAAERMIVPVGLLQRNPGLRLLFTGGSGHMNAEKFTEAERAKIFFDNLNVPANRVSYEPASRTTYENALFSAKLPGVDPKQPWLLVTSAYHMPRSVAAFRKAGWNITPYAVDFRTSEEWGWTDYSLTRGAVKWHLFLHETIGLFMYRLSGRA